MAIVDTQPEDIGVAAQPVLPATEYDPYPGRVGFTIQVPDMLRRSVEASSGGRDTILYDANGIPSVMTMLYREEVDEATNFLFGANTVGDVGSGAMWATHPAFVVQGTQLERIFVAKYLTSWLETSQETTSSGQIQVPVSMPGTIPAYNISLSDMINGSGPLSSIDSKNSVDPTNPNYKNKWHALTWAEWSAIKIWSTYRGVIPYGNTLTGVSDLDPEQKGVRFDKTLPYTLTGSAPTEWYAGTPTYGFADLVGNVQEWVTGLTLATWKTYGAATDQDNALMVPVFINNNNAAIAKPSTLSGGDITKDPWLSLDLATGRPTARSQFIAANELPAFNIVSAQMQWFAKNFLEDNVVSGFTGSQIKFVNQNTVAIDGFDRSKRWLQLLGLIPADPTNMTTIYPDGLPEQYTGNFHTPLIGSTDEGVFYPLIGGNAYPFAPDLTLQEGEWAPGGFLSVMWNDGTSAGPQTGRPWATGGRMAVVELPEPNTLPPTATF